MNSTSGPNSGKAIALSDSDRLLYASRIASKASLSDSGCLEWGGACTVSVRGDRRPVMKQGGKLIRAYRVAAACVLGTLPAGKVVAHLCDNPMCVRPSHLTAMSQNRNIADRSRKGRDWAGYNDGGRTIPAHAKAIYEMVDSGMPQHQVARLMGLSQPAICYWIKKRRASND
jgi:hypothetical protein